MIVERIALTVALAVGSGSPMPQKNLDQIRNARPQIEQPAEINIPSRVDEFKESLLNPNGRLGIIGVIAFSKSSKNEIFALPVEGQYGNPGLVWRNIITQFYQPLYENEPANNVLLSEQYGETGMEFRRLVYGDIVAIVFGKGDIEYYKITNAIVGQSVIPYDPKSNIIINGQEIGVIDAAKMLYTDQNAPFEKGDVLTLQTCLDDLRKLFLFGDRMDKEDIK